MIHLLPTTCKPVRVNLEEKCIKSDINVTILQCVMSDKHQIFLKAFCHATQTSFT